MTSLLTIPHGQNAAIPANIVNQALPVAFFLVLSKSFD